MKAEECSVCGESRSPAIEEFDENGDRYVVCWKCDERDEEQL